jgi:tRNA(Ile)-lysidine synthase
MAYTKTLKLKTLVADLPDCEGYLIAYSGGADSTALLHLFSQSKNVRAIHINHGLQDEADAWQNHCQTSCKKLGIELIIENAILKDASENSCRKARYGFFKKHLKPNEILLTAHHTQDQAETVLLKLLRGTGISGLTGMDKLRKFSNGFMARPLLVYSPRQLKDYLNVNNISWIEDASNKDNSYRRNYIRNEILPALQLHFPQAIENMARTADNTKQSLELLNYLCDFQGAELAIAKLKQLPNNLQSSLVYHWLSQKNMPLPDTKALHQITNDFIHASQDKNPHYQNNYYQLFRSQGAIYCIQNFGIIDSETTFQWNTNQPFQFPNGCGTLTYSGLIDLDLQIKFNQKGQKLKLPNRSTKTVKNLFQEHSIHQWDKLNTPFIYKNNELISLGYSWSHVSLEHLFTVKLNTRKF